MQMQIRQIYVLDFGAARTSNCPPLFVQAKFYIAY